jgi:hypothetical protein
MLCPEVQVAWASRCLMVGCGFARKCILCSRCEGRVEFSALASLWLNEGSDANDALLCVSRVVFSYKFM